MVVWLLVKWNSPWSQAQMRPSRKSAIIVITTLLLSGNVLGLSVTSRDIKHVYLHWWQPIGSLPHFLSPSSSFFLRNLSIVNPWKLGLYDAVIKGIMHAIKLYARNTISQFSNTLNLKEHWHTVLISFVSWILCVSCLKYFISFTLRFSPKRYLL